MNFLEAHRLLKDFASDAVQPFFLGMSGTAEQLLGYVRAYAAQDNIDARPRTQSFGTLSQTLLQPEDPEEREVFLLFPWDFVPEFDWRSGVPETVGPMNELFESALSIANRLKNRAQARVIYIPAPVPPIFSDMNETGSLSNSILGLARGLGANILSPDVFTLGGYLATGNPMRGDRLANVAKAVWETASGIADGYKILVTDLDGVMWSGVIGEDGLEGISCGPEGSGFSHFFYQSLLRKLEASGVILAAVSRNDEEIALAPFKAGQLQLVEQNFVAILASYEAKSAQISLLAKQLNLGLESFVFVDDNPVELVEVSITLPQVTCLQFPDTDDGLVEFTSRIGGLFSRTTVTKEDRERSEMYRRRMSLTPPSESAGADIEDFLRGLKMQLNLYDRTSGDQERAVQLINKTNQFNLNGRRINAQEVAEKLASGARFYTAGLADRAGTHGEVIACLVEPGGLVSSFVMSCRVFQRRLEYAFLVWLSERIQLNLRFEFAPTERNSPMARFLADPACTHHVNDVITLDRHAFNKTHRSDADLFQIEEHADD